MAEGSPPLRCSGLIQLLISYEPFVKVHAYDAVGVEVPLFWRSLVGI